MKNKSETSVKWLPSPEEHDYPAAASYLSLIYDDETVQNLLTQFKDSSLSTSEFKAKDVFRASRLSLLGISNSHVEKNVKKIEAGKALSPLLLVRDHKNGNVVIADGYHRMCSVYGFDEDASIPCQIATLPL